MVTTPDAVRPSSAAPAAARAGLWLLPVHALLLALGTLTHQPDPSTQFDAYARYVTTAPFLAGHLGASIAGAALGALGAVALAGVLAGSRTAAVAVVALVAGNVVTAAVFGAAAFAQPAVGRAYLRGVAEAPAIDADVYGPALVSTALVGVLLLLVGSVALGVAGARAGLRAAGVVYAVAMTGFLVVGFVVHAVQPVSAVVAAAAAGVIALRLSRAG